MVADPRPGPLEAAAHLDAGDLCVVQVAERGGLHPPPKPGKRGQLRPGVQRHPAARGERHAGNLATAGIRRLLLRALPLVCR